MNLRALAAVGLLAAAPAAGMASPPGVAIDESRAGGDVTLLQGSTLTVELPSTPGTGYAWTLSRLPRQLVALDNETVETPFVGGPPPVGRPATQRFVFRAAAVGDGRLVLAYRRSWESDAARQYRVTVRVRPALRGRRGR